MVEKAKALTLSEAKKNEYGETGKYVKFTDGKGKAATASINQAATASINQAATASINQAATASINQAATASINQAAIDKDLLFAGYNLLVTSETEMSDLDIYNTYHNLWRIEECFKIMKSDLDARPAFLQLEDTIKGHFLICYLSVLLERILQFKVLKDQYSASEIFRFIKGFQATKADNKYINATTYSDFVGALADLTALPLTNYFLSETQIKSIFNHKL